MSTYVQCSCALPLYVRQHTSVGDSTQAIDQKISCYLPDSHSAQMMPWLRNKFMYAGGSSALKQLAPKMLLTSCDRSCALQTVTTAR
jgi:hypothetical protein